MIRGNLTVVAAAFAVSAAAYFLADLFPSIVDDAPGPGFVPKLLAYAMALLALVLLMQTLFMMRAKKRGEGKPPGEDPVFSSPSAKLSYRLAGVSILYVCLIALAGFVPASLLFIPAGMRVMGERGKLAMALVSLGVVGGFYLVFAKFFNMPLPTGMLFG